MSERIVPEMSRTLGVDKIPAGGMEEFIVARPTERAALAQRFKLLDLSKLEATFTVEHAPNRMVSVVGRVMADVVQQCVVTLEPLPVHVDEKIDVLFATKRAIAEMLEAEGGHVDVGPDDEPEPLINGIIDLGELASQHLALALDPYPRKKGAALPDSVVAKPDETPKENPFALLKDIIKVD